MAGPAAGGSPRVIRVGVLGFGRVGQAVARAAAAAAPRLGARGLAVSIECALVQDVGKPRAARAARLTSNAEAFLRGRYDAVIDALPGRHPAAAIVGRLLGRGTPVASANKALIAADGRRLRRIAARAGASLGVEACVIAGVPFLGALERRMHAAGVTRLSGIVSGTANFILSRLSEGVPFDEAVGEAQALGYAEPDPSADVSGKDAMEKLRILAELCFGVELDARAIAPVGLSHLTAHDLAEAARRGGTIKPLITAERNGRGVKAFVGPAFVHASHPLAAVAGRDNALVIETRHHGRLLFAGPGAGPDITAATLLDDVIEAAEERARHA